MCAYMERFHLLTFFPLFFFLAPYYLARRVHLFSCSQQENLFSTSWWAGCMCKIKGFEKCPSRSQKWRRSPQMKRNVQLPLQSELRLTKKQNSQTTKGKSEKTALLCLHLLSTGSRSFPGKSNQVRYDILESSSTPFSKSIWWSWVAVVSSSSSILASTMSFTIFDNLPTYSSHCSVNFEEL